jgi:hypothetical protein
MFRLVINSSYRDRVSHELVVYLQVSNSSPLKLRPPSKSMFRLLAGINILGVDGVTSIIGNFLSFAIASTLLEDELKLLLSPLSI